ncbi:uncharacterized protein LOC118399232 [Oncorhynchus keta]|uniref:uncharacterized protein LOC118399232 n=1 Tax=Oncorhynchus keta TaxID=8018 RepID=UPI0015FDB3D6|nr:uncharacterized protein LOC118399232 [Oncorhynchus keta]
MGKPLSRPDCLRKNPRCLGKGDEDEAYIEDCYVPQRSIYDTMRINEQIDQGSKLSQPSRSTLGSGGGGEGSTLSSNGTIGADLGSVFVSRGHTDAGVKRLDERVIFDALKLTGDPQSMLSPGSGGGSGLPIAASSSASCGAAAVKRRHQGGDKKDNPNRRSWKAFMPPCYPEFAERLEFTPGESAEKHLSGPGIPLSLLQPPTPTSTTPLPPYSPSTVSSVVLHTPPVSSSPSLTPTVSPIPPLQQHPVSKQKQLHPLLQKQHKQTHALLSPSKEQPSLQLPAQPHQGSGSTPQHSPGATTKLERKRDKRHRWPVVSPRAGVKRIPEERPEAAKASDSERDTDSPLLEQEQDNAPLLPQLAPPKPVFCPPTKARTWPRSMRGGKRSHGGMRHHLPVLPPLPPSLGEDSDMDEESFYLLDPPSPFLQEEKGLAHGGLPFSPSLSQEGGEEGLLGWAPPNSELRQRTASELKFDEDERRVLQELDEKGEVEEEGEGEEGKRKEIEEEGTREVEEVKREKGEMEEEERARREEREWKLENMEIMDQCWEGDSGEGWELQQVSGSSGHWPLLTPPTGFEAPGDPGTSPCPSSGASSDDLFLELERQCLEDEEGESSVNTESREQTDPYNLASVEEEEQEEATYACKYFVETLPMDIDQSTETDCTEPRLKHPNTVSPPEHMDQAQPQTTEHTDLEEEQPCYELDRVLIEDEQYDIDEEKQSAIEDEEQSGPETTEMDSVCGPLPVSDSSGVHMSQPDRTALSGTTQNGCEHEPPAETEWDLDSGASSDQEVEEMSEESGLCLQMPSALPPSPSPQNPYAEGEEQEEGEPAWNACEQPDPILDIEVVSMDQSPGSIHTDGEMGVTAAEDVDVQTSCQEELFSSEVSDVAKETSSDTERMTLPSSETRDRSVPADEVSSLDVSRQDADPRSTSTPKAFSDSLPHSHSPSPLPLFPVKHEPRGPGLDSKDSDAFVATDSFVYLAVSVPPLFPQDCPLSLLESSTPPSPIPNPCPDPDDGAFLCPDSFVYLAAPERLPQVSDGGSACEDAQELDYGDSYSEGTQSGVDFVLGSMTGDSDWESDGSALDPPCTNREWEELESELLQGLFREGQMEDQMPPGATTEAEWSDCETPSGPKTTEQRGAPSPCPDIETHAESDSTFLEIRK